MVQFTNALVALLLVASSSVHICQAGQAKARALLRGRRNLHVGCSANVDIQIDNALFTDIEVVGVYPLMGQAYVNDNTVYMPSKKTVKKGGNSIQAITPPLVIPAGQMGVVNVATSNNGASDQCEGTEGLIAINIANTSYVQASGLNSITLKYSQPSEGSHAGEYLYTFNQGSPNMEYATSGTQYCHGFGGSPGTVSLFSPNSVQCQGQTGLCATNPNLFSNYCPSSGNNSAVTGYAFSATVTNSVQGYSGAVKMLLNQTITPNSRNTNYNQFTGFWKQDATNGQVTYSATITSTQGNSQQVTNVFTQSLATTKNMGFRKDGVSVGLSKTATQSVSHSSSTTFSSEFSVSESSTCQSECESGTRVYRWAVNGTGTDWNDLYTAAVSCDFACVPESINGGPKCPMGYCGDEACQCCNAKWNADDTTAAGNFLCTVAPTASPTTSPTSSRFFP